VIPACILLDMLDGMPAHLMLWMLLLVRASQMALIASRVNVPRPFWATPQSWLLSKLQISHIPIRQVENGVYPVGHIGWSPSSPDALDIALGQGVTDRVDRVESELAVAELVDTAELVGVQAVKHHTFRMG
jgi:hypothetical protein